MRASISPAHKCKRVLHAHFESGKLQLDFDEQLDDNFDDDDDDDETDVEDSDPARASQEGGDDRRVMSKRR